MRPRRVTIPAGLFGELEVAARAEGYTSAEELVLDVLERKAAEHRVEAEEVVEERLRGLGYIK